MVKFKSTTTPQSERLLAHTLGYPKSWHVQRICPHPTLQKPNTFQDTIYAGDPEIADRYFNHTAAMDAAMRWVDGESTQYDDGGGQLLPLVDEDIDDDDDEDALVNSMLELWDEGDEVEVYYEKDREWCHATIIEVLEYKDDVRFTVQYTNDESTQTNVCLERIRELPSNKNKKNKKNHTKKRKAAEIDDDDDDDEDELDLHETASSPTKSKGKNTPKKAKPKSKSPSKKSKGNNPMPIEEGDPPWRTNGHAYLGKRIEYHFPDGVIGKGICTGWIAAKDVDKDGQPGFVSERTNKPACLFHVTMDEDCQVESQDFEGYEMEEIFIDDTEE